MNILTLLLSSLFTLTSFAGQGVLEFSRDDRPADGALTELVIDMNDASSSLSFTQSIVDRWRGKLVISRELDVKGLNCRDVRDEEDRLVRVICSRDDRPVDGVLTIVTINRKEGGFYSATMYESFLSRSTGEEVSGQEILADKLRLR